MRRLALCAAVLALGQSGRDDLPTIEGLLQRAGAYVVDFETRFASVVAEERYTQIAPAGTHGTRGARSVVGTLVRRDLRSDFLMVKVPSESRWLPFRDVFEVDGKPVRDRQDRLTKLFLQPSATAIEQATQIIEESARYNIGDVQRNINLPVLALTILEPGTQPRFRFFRLHRTEQDVWSVDFEEQAVPTLIHGRKGIDRKSRGRFWIEAATGRVVRTELQVDDVTVSATIRTDYRFDPDFGLTVPAEMREQYILPRLAPVTGNASYSRFRRFSVQTGEAIRKAPVLVEIPAGRFTMGSPESEAGRGADETAHVVTISKSFLLGRFEVTQEEWATVVGSNPSRFGDCGPTCPVENVTFADVGRFLDTLNAQNDGNVYRLPTEAEWEYACRAGTTTPFATGANLTTDQANYHGGFSYPTFAPGVFRGRPTPVGQFAPNAWGIADMHGNVWEWTADWYGPYPAGASVDPRGPSKGEKRVIRGGSWAFDANSARCALRYTHAPADRGFSLGFRVAADRRQ